MDDEILRLIANPYKIKKQNIIKNDYYEDIYNLLQKHFNHYDINYNIYNTILNKIENMLIENTIVDILNNIINTLDTWII